MILTYFSFRSDLVDSDYKPTDVFIFIPLMNTFLKDVAIIFEDIEEFECYLL